jgi:hypothetical protein
MRMILILLLAGAAAAGEASFATGPRGLAALVWDGWSMLGYGSYQGDLNLYGTRAEFRRADGSTYASDADTDAHRVATVGDVVGLDLPWGTVRTAWAAAGSGRIRCTVTIRNTSADTLTGVGGSLVILDLPVADPQVSDGDGDGPASAYPRTVRCLTGAPYLMVDMGSRGRLVAAIEGDLGSDWTLGEMTAFNGSARWRFAWGCRAAIPPGESRTQVFGLRFLPAGTRFAEAAPDLLMRHAGAWPPLGDRGDRRPISRLFLCNPPDYTRWPTTGHPPGNPRGYFQNSEDVDIRTIEGRTALRLRLLDLADGMLDDLRAAGAQGVVVWDIEGQQEPHMTSYVGSPDRVFAVAPEMAHVPVGETLATADAFFRRFRDAGFRVGVCLRPQRYGGDAPGPYTQAEIPDLEAMAELMRVKIAFAAERWGADLFYVDSNVSDLFGWPVPDRRLFGPALRDHPRVLLMGEWQQCASWGVGAPYDATWYDGTYETPERVREVWPDAGTAIVVGSGDGSPVSASAAARHLAAARRGDILLFDGWYASESLAVAKDVAATIGNRPALAWRSPGPGAAVPSGTAVALAVDPVVGASPIARVVYRCGPVEIGRPGTAPWRLDWMPPGDGAWIVTATAETVDGTWASAPPLMVTVGSTPRIVAGPVASPGAVALP